MRIFGKVASLTAKGANGEGTPVNVGGMESSAIAVRGTFTAECVFKASADGVTWFDMYGHDVSDANHDLAKKVTAPALIQFRDLSGIQFLRADVENWSSGAVTAELVGIG
jgi:hypothetical protein